MTEPSAPPPEASVVSVGRSQSGNQVYAAAVGAGTYGEAPGVNVWRRPSGPMIRSWSSCAQGLPVTRSTTSPAST